MFGVETNSFLPDEQNDGRDLARQSEASHRRFHSFGEQRDVEILKGPAVTLVKVAVPLKIFFRSWLWLTLSPRVARSFLERWSCPSRKRYSVLIRVASARPL